SCPVILPASALFSSMTSLVASDQQPSSARGQKRRLHDLLAEKMNGQIDSPSVKREVRQSGLEQYRFALNDIMARKEQFIRKQRHSSLVIDPRRIDDDGVMAEFANLYQQVLQLQTDTEDHAEHRTLIGDILKGSIILEWPRAVYGVHKSGHDEATEVDQAPLIHRARNVVKCRTSHPTMRIKVYALSAAAEQHRGTDGPQLVEALFRCSLTKAQSGVVGETCDSRNATIAGRMILTQREGTAAPKTTQFTGAQVNGDGKLVALQSVPDCTQSELCSRSGEMIRSTSFKYENGVLCATFPEMGVTLNSMVDRRQLATRYAILNEVFIKIGDPKTIWNYDEPNANLIVDHAFQSLPFLIAITNDQTEPLLNSIIWSRMMDREHYDGSEPQLQITYGVLKEASKQFVKSQISQARSLTNKELLHFQAMQFLPKVNKCRNEFEVINLESYLYLDPEDTFMDPRASETQIADIDKMRERKRLLKDKLLTEFVKDHVIIEKHDFMGETCVSILDGRSELRHTPWQWLFKKQLAAAEEYHTMMSLFNKGVVSFFSVYDTIEAFNQLKMDGEDTQDGGNVMLRFCDENAGHISFVFGLDIEEKLIMGSIAGETIKDFKQGLSEALMDEEFPSHHGRLVRMNVHPDRMTEKLCTTIRKRSLFNTYQSLRQIETKTPFPDEDLTKRINPFTGNEIKRDMLKLPLFMSPLDSALSAMTNSPFSSPLMNSLPQTTTIKKRGRKPANQAQSLPPTLSEPSIFFNESLFSSLNSASPTMFTEMNGDHEPEKQKSLASSKSSSPPISSSPKTTVASPFASLSVARPLKTEVKAEVPTLPSSSSNGSNGVPPVVDPSVAMMMMEQPMFQNMLAQIMQQTVTQMFSGGDMSRIGAETTDVKPQASSNKVKLKNKSAAQPVPKSLDDILRATQEASEGEEEY
ncbi:hypothetical protein PMAYCL1PPCAC_11408, partial [Pristionchus mayeri]